MSEAVRALTEAQGRLQDRLKLDQAKLRQAAEDIRSATAGMRRAEKGLADIAVALDKISAN